jgi:hypothetical protein
MTTQDSAGESIPAPEDLVGVWRLVSHTYLDADRGSSPGPLGDDATGLLIYAPDGHMSVALMRRPTGSGPVPDGRVTDYLGYAGQWHLESGTVVHQVEVGSHRRVVGTRQIRQIGLSQGTLTLRERLDESPRHLVLRWRRA